MSIVNGKNGGRFDGNGFDNFAHPYFIGRINKVTDDVNIEILRLGENYVNQEDYLVFPEITDKKMLMDLSNLHTNFEKKYEEELSLYRYECNFKNTHCCFESREDQSGLDASKCRLNQYYVGVSTTIEAHKLGNKLKIYFLVHIKRTPALKYYYKNFCENLGAWPRTDEDEEPLEIQLLREVSVVVNGPLRDLFSIWLKDLVPRLERRFQPYEGCETFGHRKCLVCGDNFSNTLLQPLTLPLPIEKKPDPRHFYGSRFRKVFYAQLVDFLELVSIHY